MRQILAGLLLLVVATATSAASLEPGDRAPEFSLPGSDGEIWTLSQFSGKQGVVLAWFPKAFTPG